MSDVQLLFLVLALLYGWECACWLRHGSVAFTTWFGRRWCVQHPGTVVGNDKGGFVVSMPLPPLGTLLTANQLPFSCSPEALLACVSTNVNPGPRATQGSRLMRFDELREIRAVGKRVLLNNELFLKVGSNTLATSIARRIEHLRKLPSRQRDAAIGTMCRETLDSEAIERRWAEFRANAGSLRLLGNILVVFVFVFAPVVIWNLGFKLTWLGLLIGLLCLTTTTAFLFRRAHGRLFAKAEDERFTHTLTILLSPATAMRAHDVLSRPLLETFHPLAVAQVFLRKERFRPFARRLLLDIRHPAPPVFPTNDPVACSADRSWRAAMQAAMEDSLKRHGCNPEELCRPPLPLDQSCCAFCPRCEAQFTTSSARCADCGGLPVVAFSAP